MTRDQLTAFYCNICGSCNSFDDFATEPASCRCGSNVRMRALIHLLSIELFEKSLILTEFPKLKSIRGIGMSDQQCYAQILADKFDYTNTYYDREPRFDFTEAHQQFYGSYDFILSSDVIEHVAPPIERLCDEACRLLKPRGFFGVTVYCNPADKAREHFPDLHDYRIVPLGDTFVLVNRKQDGALEIHEDLVFHAGEGATLEMREFGITLLRDKLLTSGFREVNFFSDDVPGFGIIFDRHVSQPLVARKERFALDSSATSQLIDELYASQREQATERERTAYENARVRDLETQIQMATNSKWMQLGRLLGLGPKL